MKAVLKNHKGSGWTAPILAQVALWLLLSGFISTGAQLTNCTETELRDAVALGGLITFAGDCVITLTAPITVSTATILDGTEYHVTISGGGAVRVFEIQTNISLSAIHLTIADGFSPKGGAILNNAGRLTLMGVEFRSNTACLRSVDSENAVAGGAVYSVGGRIDATNCVFLRNTAQQPPNTIASSTLIPPAYGGALFIEGSTVLLHDCHFISNSAAGFSGDGVWQHDGSDGAGGAIYDNGDLTVDACTFQWNQAAGAAAGMVGIPSIAGFTAGTGRGGAIVNVGNMSVYGTTLVSNSVSGGRGGSGFAGPGSPGGFGQAGGRARGGAIFNSGYAVIGNCALVSNLAVGGAGGSGGNGAGPACPEPYCWPARGGDGGNGGDAQGSGLCNERVANVWNTTLAANLAIAGDGGWGGATPGPNAGFPPPITGGNGGGGGSAGGAIYDMIGLALTNCTVALNSASNGIGGAGGFCPVIPGAPGTNGIASGGLWVNGGYLINTLLVTNYPLGTNCIGTITDAGHNLSSDATPLFVSSSSFNRVDPMLGELGYNGGPTPTLALLRGSSAIDSADTLRAPLTDQRGHPRPVGWAADIGAFEYAWVPLLRISSMPPTAIQLSAYSDVTGSLCQLFATSNFLDWAPIATNQVGREGIVSFDVLQKGEVQQFYRVNQIMK